MFDNTSPERLVDTRLTSPFSTNIGYVGDRVLGGDLVPPR